jgi:hypothetical protein
MKAQEEIHSVPWETYDFHWVDFHETRTWQKKKKKKKDFLKQISRKSDKTSAATLHQNQTKAQAGKFSFFFLFERKPK